MTGTSDDQIVVPDVRVDAVTCGEFVCHSQPQSLLFVPEADGDETWVQSTCSSFN